MKEFLFLGDSITDCDNSFDSEGLGNGYVRLISQHFSNQSIPAHIHNMGVDGYTISSAKRLWNMLCKNMKPTTITILVGINDIAVMKSNGIPIALGLSNFISNYEALIHDIRSQTACHP